jgi:predicted amidohydrolase YtcJ
MGSNSADLILGNANVLTGKPAKTAQAVTVKGDTIRLVGSNHEAEEVKGPNTRVIDCQGKTLVPGFNDSHCHIFSFIRQLFSLDLSPASVRSITDIQEAIRRKARFSPEGRWISGSGYNEFYLAEKRHPTRIDLDEAAPSNPVILMHRSQHALVLNSLALKRVGITNESEAPSGGVIERDLETGEPNGILFEMLGYVRERIKVPFSAAETDWGIAEANRQYLSLGITSLGEASESNDLAQWQTFQKIKAEGKLQSRICMMAGAKALAEFREAGLSTGAGDHHLRLGSLKIVLSEASGQLHPSQDTLNRMVLEAEQAGFPVAIHAVERSTVEAAINALEYAEGQKKDQKNPLRHRIEHCSECPPQLIRRLKKLGTVVVSQPPFIYYNGERYLSQVSPEAQKWLYPFKSLIDNGITLAGSSDSPIVPNSPLIGIYAAVTRLAESGQYVLKSEAVSPGQALEMYTRNGAYASFEETIKGSLAPGRLADIAVLSGDPLHLPPELIKDIAVEMTVIGGKVVWEK